MKHKSAPLTFFKPEQNDNLQNDIRKRNKRPQTPPALTTGNNKLTADAGGTTLGGPMREIDWRGFETIDSRLEATIESRLEVAID